MGLTAFAPPPSFAGLLEPLADGRRHRGPALVALRDRVRALRQGRLRDHALGLALGTALLLVLAWGRSWV